MDQQLMLDALDGAAADSPYLHVKGQAIIDGSFAPQFTVDGALSTGPPIHVRRRRRAL